MTRTLPLPTRTEAQQLTELDARLRLDTAVDALTKPTVEKIARIDRALDSIAAAQTREDREIDHGLAATHARLLGAGHAAQAATVLSRLLAHRRVVADRTARQDVREAEVPSLLDQVRDAVESSSGGGAGSVGPQRAPIGLGAAELLYAIACFVGAPAGSYLPMHVQEWAGRRGASPEVDDVTPAAKHAEEWVEQARAILTPPKRWTHPGACPACGRTTAYVRDESGQQVRRPALELNRGDASARCLRCGATWKGEGQLRSLARVLEDQAG